MEGSPSCHEQTNRSCPCLAWNSSKYFSFIGFLDGSKAFLLKEVVTKTAGCSAPGPARLGGGARQSA
eukprot:4533262-Prymnesium_polylepis.1